MSAFVQYLASGLALGSIYALVALGFVIIYRASGVFNFAQGEFLVVGAFVMVVFAGTGLPWIVALGLTMLTTALLAMAIERGLLRPLLGRPVFVPIILTIIVGLVLRVAVTVIWGSQPGGMPVPWPTTGSVSIFGASILYNGLATLIFGGAALGVYVLLSRRTRLGLGMRATSDDPEAAMAVGIPVGRVLAVTWGLAGAFAALGGVLLSTFPRNVEIGLAYVALRALPAVIIGGLTSVGGTIIAGLLLGVIEIMAQAYLNPRLGQFGHNFHAVFPYLVMIVFLVVRPYGIFGRKEVDRL